MGQSLSEILAQLGDGGRIGMTMASNQDNGLVSYAQGTLVYHKAVFVPSPGPGGIRNARLESDPNAPFTMLFSDRIRQVDVPPPPPPPPPGAPPTLGASGKNQPFDVDQPEALGVSISLGLGHTVMTLSLFNSRSAVMLSPMGDLMVGLGPSLGNSAAGVFAVAFATLTPGPK